MKKQDVGALLLLSTLWGGSFLCMRVAAPVLGPIVLIELRVIIAGLALLAYVLFRRQPLELRTRWWHYLVIGVLNSAIPFTFIATAELHLAAGLSAILNATSPLFGAVIAALWIKEALTPRKIIGLILGLAGVAVLVGWSPLPFSQTIAWSLVFSLAAAAFYGLGGVYTKIYAQGYNSLALATCSQIGAALVLMPLAVTFPPQQLPTTPVIIAVVILALVCTAIAYLIYFGLIARVGPTRALTVTFLVPGFGVFWGVLLLHEPLTLSTLLGFAIILAGTGFVTGIPLPRRSRPPEPAQKEYNETNLTSTR